MKIASARKLQYPLDTLIKVLKFVWRYAFVLIVFGMMIAALIVGQISWINCFYFYVGAAFIDCFKNSLKLKSGPHRSLRNLTNRDANWATDPSQVGSPAWNANPFAPGSSAYYSRQNSSTYN